MIESRITVKRKNKTMKTKKTPEMIVLPELSLVKRYERGYCYAVRFAEGMSRESILESIARFPIEAKEWRPYDEGTNCFV